MKAYELVEKMIGFTPERFDGENTCDRYIVGDENKEVSRVAVTMFATKETIEEAARWGAQLLIVHEPVYYNHWDDRFPTEFAVKKKEMLEENGIAVFRFHDGAHAMLPDLICAGNLHYAGLKGTFTRGKYFAVNNFELEQEMTARELAKLFEERIGIKRIKIAGAADKPGRKLACCFGTPGHIEEELKENDFVLVGEICEWHIGEMARDYASFGSNKAVLVMSHLGSEKAGMKYLAEMITERVPELECRYFENEDIYSYTDESK